VVSRQTWDGTVLGICGVGKFVCTFSDSEVGMKYYNWRKDFSDTERETIVQEMAKIVVGYIYQTAEEQIAEVFDSTKPTFCGQDKIILPWTIEILGNDILAQVGKLRFEK